MNEGIAELRRVVAVLRGPGGCPWDIEQTHESLLPGLLEECHELIDAVHTADEENLREELGDLLLQTVMHCQMAAETNRFDFDKVAQEVAEKLIRRHPHVFGGAPLANSEQVLQQWDSIKAQEKQERTSLLDGVPASLPALMRAHKLTHKAAKVGFDWSDSAPVVAKVREELAEFESAMEAGQGMEEELGDLLFSVVNLARKSGINSELALRKATDKFQCRFQYIEAALKTRGLDWSELDLAALDVIWDEAKQHL